MIQFQQEKLARLNMVPVEVSVRVRQVQLQQQQQQPPAAVTTATTPVLAAAGSSAGGAAALLSAQEHGGADADGSVSSSTQKLPSAADLAEALLMDQEVLDKLASRIQVCGVC